MKRPGRFCLIALSVLFVAGCSVVMAAKQPGKKDLSVLTKGVDRGRVIAELGTPVTTEEKGGKKTDIFNFRQGYSSGAKAGRAVFHGVADVFTLGLWEVVGTPVESVASGTDVKVAVNYDTNNKVDTITTYSGKEKVDAAIVPVSTPVPEAENKEQQK